MADELYDQSHLEKKYFIDSYRYNCPFCNIRNVEYSISSSGDFNWSRERMCYYYIVHCSRCDNESLHLSNYRLYTSNSQFMVPPQRIEDTEGGRSRIAKPIVKDNKQVKDLDDVFFYHQPTSFFTIDNRIPVIIREHISEADGCLKMGYLVGASGCLRKTIYELLEIQSITKTEKDSKTGKEINLTYEERIKRLKNKFEAENIDHDYFDILAGIQGMTSDALHEGAWESFDSPNLQLIIETTKEILYEIYVLPEKRKDKKIDIKKLIERTIRAKKADESIETTTPPQGE